MANSKIKKYIEDPHQKFYYIYDFNRPFDFHVELIKIILDANEALEYPYIFKTIGEAPKIYDNKTSDSSEAVSRSKKSDEFDFLNELDFVPEDADELEALTSSGINEKESDEDHDDDEFGAEDEDENGYDEYENDDRNDDY